MNSKVEIVEKYSNTFRDLINAKIWYSKADVRNILCLKKDNDWFFLCVSMDIVGDACEAINNFLKFGLNGPTKYNDVGEKYLRLYGVLSATYIQQEALLKLYQLIDVPPSPKKEGKWLLGKLKIRILRHKLCSHSTNYLDNNTNTIQAYVPIRCDLDNFNCTYSKNGRGKHTSVDLKGAVEEHLTLMVEMLDKIVEKAIKTLFKGQESNKICVKFSERLNNLRIHKNGGEVYEIHDGSKLIITLDNKSKIDLRKK